jgi:penicillin-binding protein 2
MAFAPRENPQIAISVYVENAGWGGGAAGSTASLLIEKYLTKEIARPALETYVLNGNF